MKTKIIGLTGGIGSGKSTVSKFFEKLGVPVYNSDNRAKEIMNQNPKVKDLIIRSFGSKAYQNNQLDRAYLASQVFRNSDKLNVLNGIVHPAVKEDFENWLEKQTKPFIIKEAAILFESASYKDTDLIITVVAEKELRIERVMERSDLNREQIIKRMDAQWNDEQKIALSDEVIFNNGTLEDLEKNTNILYHNLTHNKHIF